MPRIILNILLCLLLIFPTVNQAVDEVKVPPPPLPQALTLLLNQHDLSIPNTLDTYCGFDLQSKQHPFFITGDFDGDNKQDYALVVINKQGKRQVFVIFNNGRTHYLGDWQYIRLNRDKGTLETLQGKVTISQDAIETVYCESSAAIHVYDTRQQSFKSYFLSD